MPDHAPQPVCHPGSLGWIALLFGALAGFCLGAWMLAIALEWLGDVFFWWNTCASHSEQVLQVTWWWWRVFAGAPVRLVEDLAIVSDTLQKGSAALIASLNGQSRLLWTEAVTMVIHCASLSADSVTLTFLLRLAILLQALPLSALTITIGLIDGLVRRDLRRFGVGHEFGLVYHHVRRMITSSLVATGLVWLIVPIFPVPEYVFIPATAGIGPAVFMVGGPFRKYA